MKAIETKEGRREPEREPRNSRQKAMHDDRMEEVTAEENPRRALGEDSAARAEVLLAALARRAGSLPRLAALGRARVDAALCAGASRRLVCRGAGDDANGLAEPRFAAF